MAIVEDQISFARVEDGDDGRGILGTPVATYAQSTSGTTPPTSWSATRPNVPAGQYLWTRVVTTYTDNTTSETQTPTLMGAEGESGLGIKDKSISYAAGASGNTPPITGWQETIPTVSANQYLWTKTTLVYTDESKTEAYSVGKMGANGADAKLLYLTASAENMAFNADDTPKTTQTINISAKLQNVTGTATFTAIPYIGSTAQTAITLSGTGNTRTLTSAQWTNKDWTLIAITATLDNLSDTLSIVKVKDGKEGETYYPHPAWMMADGTFTKVYPGENLASRSSLAVHSVNTTNTVTLGVGKVSIASEGVTYLGFRTYGSQYEPSVRYVMRFKLLLNSGIIERIGGHSTYIGTIHSLKINGVSQTISSWLTGIAYDFEIGKTYEIILDFTTVSSGMNDTTSNGIYIQPNRATFGKAYNADILELKVEAGNVVTPYTPSPKDDYENAYPKYEGFYSDTNEVGSDNPDDYKPWTPFMGPQGPEGDKGDSAPLISLSGATQAITVDKDGKITPSSSFTVTGTAVNTTISNWTYSLNGGNFGSAVPTGVTRLGNVVTVNPTTSTFNQLTIKADDGTVSDVFTISRITDGGDGNNGEDAYTVFLTNESYTFAGSTSAALAGSTTTEVIVYKGINKITPTSITVGTKPTGLSSSVSGSVVTFTAATTLVTKSGTIPITITVDGKTFTKQFAFALSLQGGKGDPGVSVTGTQVQYVQSSSMTEPTTGWLTTRPTPVPGQWLWTRSRSIFSDGTYGAWATVPTLIGREAIVISATAPSNPTTGTLWQTPTDPNVKQWDGANWIDWGIAPENITADNLVVKDGRFDKLIGTKLEGGVITNPFDYWDGEYVSDSNDQQWRRGQTIIEKSEITTMWEDYNKSTGEKIKEGGAIQNSNGFLVFVNDPSGYSQRSSVRMDGILIADSRGVGGATSTFLTYSDLVKIQPIQLTPATGWSVYATSGSNRPIGSRTGRIVTLSGAFKNNSVLSNSNDVITIGSVPNALRPISEVKIIVKGAGTSSYMLIVDTDGLIKIQYRLGWTGSQYGYIQNNSGDIFNIHVTYPGVDIF